MALGNLCECGCGGQTNNGNRFIRGHNTKNHHSWNTGLTKDTDPRVANNATNISKSMTGKKPSDKKLEHLLKISPLGLSETHTVEATLKWKATITETYANHPELKELNRQNAIKSNMSMKRKWTKPEISVHKYLLSKTKVSILSHKHIDGICNVDMIIPSLKVLIFVDGCYWHGCQIHHSGEYNLPHNKPVSNKRKRDIDNTIALQSLGWTVIRLWEHEIKAKDFSKLDSLIHKP